MSRIPLIASGLFLLLLALLHCRQASSAEPNDWFEALRTDIQQAADLKPDTSHFEYLADSVFSHRVFIRGGRVFREEWYGKAGDLQGVSLFTADGMFELRREICPDGSLGFEGILFKNKFYGPVRWWYCNGQIRQEGFRYANREVGPWRRYAENGAGVDSVDRGNLHLLDSLQYIRMGR